MTITSTTGAAQARPITPSVLAELQACSGYPMVSILAPTTPGGSQTPADRALISSLIAAARARFASECPDRDPAELFDAIDDLAETIANHPTGLGVALLSGSRNATAHLLQVAPHPRAVIDPTFATRDLARSILENPPYRILDLSSRTARLHLAAGPTTVECRTLVDSADAEDDAPDRRGHLHQSEPSHRTKRHLDRYLRAVETALEADNETAELPLVIAAAEPIASRFRNQSRQPIIGTIAGNHQRTASGALAALARPIIDDHLCAQHELARQRLDRAIGCHHAAIGLDEVWRAANEGSITLLLVDPTYTASAVPSADGRALTPVIDMGANVLDDAVDEIIELVAHRRGTIEFTELDADHRRIAAVLQQR
ncbi:MAG: hypothetical protein ACI8Y4_000994 [Candidatus Poriferisodalaceae bacterium]|jgi:hypothetical protein